VQRSAPPGDHASYYVLHHVRTIVYQWFDLLHPLVMEVYHHCGYPVTGWAVPYRMLVSWL
jgi:hypothetical protein